MLKNAFLDLHPIAQAGFAGLFTWTITACGAGTACPVEKHSGTASSPRLSNRSLRSWAQRLSPTRRQYYPYALSFAAGAMIFVVVEELIPESHRAGNVDLATICLMIGFTIMMVLDVALG